MKEIDIVFDCIEEYFRMVDILDRWPVHGFAKSKNDSEKQYGDNKMDMEIENKSFTAGFVYALSELIRAGAQDYAEDLWIGSGFQKSDLSFCDAYDAEKVREMLAITNHRSGRGKVPTHRSLSSLPLSSGGYEDFC